MKQLKILKPLFATNDKLEVVSLEEGQILNLIKEDEKKVYLSNSKGESFSISKKVLGTKAELIETKEEKQLELPIEDSIPSKSDFKKEILGKNDFPDKKEMMQTIEEKKNEIKKAIIQEILVETKKEIMNSIKEMNGNANVFLKEISNEVPIEGLFEESLCSAIKIIEDKGYSTNYNEQRGILTLC